MPLNDPVGGWIHWEEQPELAIQSIELVRGGSERPVWIERDRRRGECGAGAAHGRPGRVRIELRRRRNLRRQPAGADQARAVGTAGGGRTARHRRIHPGGAVRSAGRWTLTSNVRSQNAMMLVGARARAAAVVCARQRLQRGAGQRNAVPDQRDAAVALRDGRRLAGAAERDADGAALRVGSRAFRQTFSSISNLPDFGDAACSYRCGEIPTQVLAHAGQRAGRGGALEPAAGRGAADGGGADVHDVRVWDREQTFGASAALTNLHDHQRDSGRLRRGDVGAQGMDADRVQAAWTGSRTTTGSS